MYSVLPVLITYFPRLHSLLVAFIVEQHIDHYFKYTFLVDFSILVPSLCQC